MCLALLTVLVTAVGVQDRGAAKPLPWNLRKVFHTVGRLCADSGYAGKLVTWAKARPEYPDRRLASIERRGRLLSDRCCCSSGRQRAMT